MSAHSLLKVATLAGLALHIGAPASTAYGHHPTSRTVIRTYGYAPAAVPAAVPVVYGAAPGAVAGQVAHGTVPVVPWAHSSAASLGTASVASYVPAGYAPAGYTTSGYVPAGYVPAGYATSGYTTSSYLPSAGSTYAPTGLHVNLAPGSYGQQIPALTYAGYTPASVGYTPASVGYTPASVGYTPAATMDPGAAEERLRFEASQRTGTASLSSVEYQIASSTKHQDLAQRVGGAGVLSKIGQYLRQFAGTPLFKETADNLFRSFLPGGPLVQPLVNGFLDDLTRGATPQDPAADKSPVVPRATTPGGAQGDSGTSSDVTIRIRIIVEKEGGGSAEVAPSRSTPPPPPPGPVDRPGAAKVSFMPDDKVVSQSGNAIVVERDGANVTVSAPGTFQAGDVIASDLGGGIYSIKRGGKVLVYNGNKATAEGVNPKAVDIP